MGRNGRQGRGWGKPAGAVALLALSVALATGPAAAQTIDVRLDQATLTGVPERVATVIVGNPLIADVSLQPGRVLVLTGKSYGTTNVIALDNTGAVLMERTVQVKEARDATVFLWRGILRESYSCTPNCERRINLGDSNEHFNTALGQSASRNTRATAESGTGAGLR